MICEYLNKATFVNLLMAVLFSECFSADFAFQIFKLHFSQKGIFTKFLDAPPPRLFQFGFIYFLPNLAQLHREGCSKNLSRLFSFW